MKTINVKKLRQTYRAVLSKLNRFLERIKYFPWFSVLLALMLGWGGYQVTNQPHSKAAVSLKQMMKRVESGIRQAFSQEQDKKEKVVKTKEQAVKASVQPSETVAEVKEIASKAEEITSKAEAISSTVEEAPRAEEPLMMARETVEAEGIKEAPLEKVPLLHTDVSEMRILDLEKQLKTMQAACEKLQTNNAGLRKELDTIHPQLENIRHALNAQAQQFSEMTVNDVPLQEAAENETEKGEAKLEHYSVYAVIPGRVWLNTPEGKIVTVRIGSVLSPFGTVQTIDAENGLVYFDQGHVLGLSETDS